MVSCRLCYDQHGIYNDISRYYFDCVSRGPGNLRSISIEFYTATGDAFLGLSPYPGPLSVDVIDLTFAFANGTSFDILLNQSQATFQPDGDGISSTYSPGDSTSSFKVNANLSHASLSIDAPDFGINGTITLSSIAPPHAPGGTYTSKANLEVLPHLGWVNAIPDACAEVSFTVKDVDFQSTGVGYHDKNGGDQPFNQTIDSWYWGH